MAAGQGQDLLCWHLKLLLSPLGCGPAPPSATLPASGLLPNSLLELLALLPKSATPGLGRWCARRVPSFLSALLPG